MRRLVLSCCFVVAWAAPAAAHTGFDPDEAAPGSVVTVTLNAADERDNAAITKVELFLPEDVEVAVADPAGPAGWTAVALAESVAWEGPPADGDQSFMVTLGPFPAQERRLQFKVLQTYDNGDIDRWIEEYPAGAAEPDMPGPVIDLVAGGPGTIPEATTTTVLEPDPTVVIQDEATTSTAEDADDELLDTAAPDDDDGDSSALPIMLAIAALVVVAGALGAYLVRRRR